MRNLHLKELHMVMRLMKKKRWLFYLTITISATCVGAFSIINSFVYKDIINSIVENDLNLLNNAIKNAVLALILACIVSPLAGLTCAFLSKVTVYNLRMDLFKHVIHLPRKFFDKNHSGDIISTMTNDVSKINEIYDGELYNVIFHFLVGVAATYTILRLNLILSLIMISFGILTTLINTLYAKPIADISDRLQMFIGKATGRFLDVVAGIKEIKLFNLNELMVEKYSEENSNVINEGIKLTKKEAEKSSINIMLSSLTFLGVLAPGAFMVYYNTIDLGTVIAIITLKLQVFCLFEELGGFFVSLQKSLAGAKRVFNILDESIEVNLNKHYYEGSLNKIGVNIENVSFSYSDDSYVLKGLNMKIYKNQITAIVGVSGAGKSTIIKLLLGLYMPKKGKVIYDGKRNNNLTIKEVREKVSYVSQKPIMFNDTVYENIKYGNPLAKEEDVIEAAKKANCHDFIEMMSDKYNTFIGEEGNRLSGGEKQRIALARALLKKSEIILLDEATSALDYESESLIKDSLTKLSNKHTIIIVTHKLNTVIDADKIYVFDNGKIVDEGTHDLLIEKNQIYKLLHNIV